MEFYQDLSKYYEDIFPLAEDKVNLIESVLKPPADFLDIGCSTGELAMRLKKEGFNIWAIDLNEEMIEKAKTTAKDQDLEVHFEVGDMRQLKEIYQQTFAGISCFGNTIVHLTKLSEIKDFFQQVYDLLKADGVFIFQIVNYDRILGQDIHELPLIENKEKGIHFYRYYQYQPQKELIYFQTRLLFEDGREIKHQIPLYPLRAKEIKGITEQIGFSQLELYGTFRQGTYIPETSMPLIGICKK